MEDCKKIDRCRVCGSRALGLVIDMGEQCLQGQFPLIGQPDPPAFPLVLVRCEGGCGLVQLAHTVNPELMFREYGYRSGMTQTMRNHLHGIANEAVALLGRKPSKILDIGCNDGELLSRFEKYKTFRVGVDPCDLARPLVFEQKADQVRIERWPSNDPFGDQFDLIFTIACFYDSDNPIAFARAVRDNLAPDGIWCVEVAHLPAMLGKLNYDTICHEHLCYYEAGTLEAVLHQAGLRVLTHSLNNCNGGSLRVYAVREEHGLRPKTSIWEGQQSMDERLTETRNLIKFRVQVERHRENLMKYLIGKQHRKQRVHLLGASTKSNTVLQYAGVDPELIQYASDRDPRKKGRRTPGTNIPIISEEESRAMKPDVYLSLLGHFRDELVAREQDYLKSGGKIAFALPHVEEVGG